MVLETYYRKRSRKVLQATNEMDYLKQQKQKSSSMNTAISDDPSIAKQDNVPVPVDHDQEAVGVNIEIGSIYEIDHIHLPSKTAVHLRSIRVAMVSEKTEVNVAIRYPSVESLGMYLSNSMNEMYPALDEKFEMGIDLAGKVLLTQVPTQEFVEKKHLKDFWLANIEAASSVDLSDDQADALKKAGFLFDELKSNGMIRWGVRRQVKFLSRDNEHTNEFNTQSSSCFINEEENDEDDDNGMKEEVEQEENEEEDEEVEEEEEIRDEDDEMEEMNEESKGTLKRKEYNFRDAVRKAKKIKCEKQKGKKKKIPKKQNNKCRQLMVLRSPKDRWSSERYKTAEKNLLEVLKAKRAVAAKPIMRHELRVEARKKIGDTGLLDHLLKHVAGKLAPGGKERFRRRHNAEGQMEYWLENAELLSIRKEAGVSDPFWIPPTGWQPGDCPTQDPISAKELKLLKEELLQVKRDAKEMVSKQQFEEEVGRVKRDAYEMMTRKQLEFEEEVKRLRMEIKQLASKKKEEEKQAIVVSSNPCGVSQESNELATYLDSSKMDLDKAPDSLIKCQEQLSVISEFVKDLEGKIEKQMSKIEEKSKSNRAVMVGRKGCAEKDQKKQGGDVKQKRTEQEVQKVAEIRQEGLSEDDTKTSLVKTFASQKAEGKAAKIERLKSGFRICKPQGTFLWPNMARTTTTTTTTATSGSSGMLLSPHVVVQVEDLFAVPTPPSVSSSSALAPPPRLLPHHPAPASPVKPLAERRGLTVTVSTVSATTSNMTTPSMINLNDAPFHHVAAANAFCGYPSSRQAVTTSAIVPNVHSSSMDCDYNASREATSKSINQEQHGASCSSVPCLNTQTENWLALATPNSNSDKSCQF